MGETHNKWMALMSTDTYEAIGFLIKEFFAEDPQLVSCDQETINNFKVVKDWYDWHCNWRTQV